MAVALSIFLRNPPAGKLRAETALADARQRKMKENIALGRRFKGSYQMDILAPYILE
jgi:hypothetical protein